MDARGIFSAADLKLNRSTHRHTTGGPAAAQRRRRIRRGIDIRHQDTAEDVAGYLREQQIALTFDPAVGTLQAGTGEAAQTITLKAS